ncbi:MAG TPA: MBL fold metallo-hydrolase [Terracidiphilus sp.]
MPLQQPNRRVFLQTLAIALAASVVPAAAEETAPPPKEVAPGVWFLEGVASKGDCNNAVIEMRNSLIVVDAGYPQRAKDVMRIIPQLSRKPVRWVFDTHAHRDHAYGNALWTRAGATTLAYKGVVDDMNRWEPARWQATMEIRPDVRATGEKNVQRPERTFSGPRFTIRDPGANGRVVEFLHLGWGHTLGDGFVWLPKERVLCTGDAAVNGPRNKLMDAWIANWAKALDQAQALQPKFVLPGHGEMGGAEILVGQRKFLFDLLAAVRRQTAQGLKPDAMQIQITGPAAHWQPANAAAWRQDIETAYLEITSGKPAGANPHVWK